MFFILSKTLDFLIQPLNWIFFLLLCSIFLYKKKAFKVTFFTAVFMTFFFSNPIIIDSVFNIWEPERKEYADLDNYDLVVVLGGYSSSRATPKDRVHFTKGADRLIHSVELFKMGKAKRILITGGSGRLVGKKISEAENTRSLLLNLGISPNDLIIEGNSRNTHENAVNTAAIIKEQGFEKILLVTSAFHMKRAHACFKKEGLEVDIFPTDYYGSSFVLSFSKTILPKPDAFERWRIILKEWFGIVAYKVAGYI